MKKFYLARCSFLLAALLMVCLTLPTAGAASVHNAAAADNSTNTKHHYMLPIYQFGYEIITEGTVDYPIVRTMRYLFPLDMDITVIYAWGYTGDKFIIKVTDLGDMGDRLFACAIVMVDGKPIVQWGTMYSSSTQNSFEVTMPMKSPGGLIYLLSGFLNVSLGVQAYNYSMALSFPQ